MSTLCEPNCQLSTCDDGVKIGESLVPLYLLVWKGNKRLCDIEITPELNNDLLLTNDMIIDFADEVSTFKIQLRTSNNAPTDIMYKDCSGTNQVAETIRLKFNECDITNFHLNEICNN